MDVSINNHPYIDTANWKRYVNSTINHKALIDRLYRDAASTKGFENMIPMALTYGREGFNEIREFLKKHEFKGYTLSIFDTLEQASIEVKCDFDDMLDVIVYVSSVVHDSPAWIGVNELSNSYVVGMSLARGRLRAPSLCEWKNKTLSKLV